MPWNQLHHPIVHCRVEYMHLWGGLYCSLTDYNKAIEFNDKATSILKLQVTPPQLHCAIITVE